MTVRAESVGLLPTEFGAEAFDAITLICRRYGGTVKFPCQGVTDIILKELQRVMAPRRIRVRMSDGFGMFQTQTLWFDDEEVETEQLAFGTGIACKGPR
jgi:hypothetical protein